MKIQEFCNMKKFEGIMSNQAKTTGLATVAVGADGKYISACYNFTDFCIKLTRGVLKAGNVVNIVMLRAMASMNAMQDLLILEYLLC